MKVEELIEDCIPSTPRPQVKPAKSLEQIAREQGNWGRPTVEAIDEILKDGPPLWDTEEQFEEFLKIIADGRDGRKES